MLLHLWFLKAITLTISEWSLLPGESKDVVYERGPVLVCKDTDIVGQSLFKGSPAFIPIVDDVEACVSVVQFQPLYTFWHLKSA